MKPTGFDILIEKIPEEQVSSGGIILVSDEGKKTHPTAKIISMGMDVEADGRLIEGDTIMYIRNSDREIEAEGILYHLVQYQSVIAKL